MYSYKYDDNGTKTHIIEHDPNTKKEKQAYIATFKY